MFTNDVKPGCAVISHAIIKGRCRNELK